MLGREFGLYRAWPVVSSDADPLSPAPVADPRPAAGGVVRAAAVVGSATLVSRVLGFLRDLVVAQVFGAGPATDAFFMAFRLPNLLRRLVGEGALSSAFIPVFTEYLTTRPRADLLRMFRAVTGGMLVVLAALTLLGVVAAPLLVRVMAPGFFADSVTGPLTVRLTRLMFPYLFFVGLAALAMGMLNAHRHFLMPALAPIMLNLSIIGAVFLVAPRLDERVFGLAVGVLVGGVGQLLIQLPALARRGLLVAPTLDRHHPAVDPDRPAHGARSPSGSRRPSSTSSSTPSSPRSWWAAASPTSTTPTGSWSFPSASSGSPSPPPSCPRCPSRPPRRDPAALRVDPVVRAAAGHLRHAAGGGRPLRAARAAGARPLPARRVRPGRDRRDGVGARLLRASAWSASPP